MSEQLEAHTERMAALWDARSQETGSLVALHNAQQWWFFWMGASNACISDEFLALHDPGEAGDTLPFWIGFRIMRKVLEVV